MGNSIRYGCFDIALRFKFTHASASRTRTNNIIVELSDHNGLTGYGEGCPRKYVTGETSSSALSFVGAHASQFASEVQCLEDLRSWINRNSELIDQNPSAFCAMELAAIDLFARQKGGSAEKLLNLPTVTAKAQYTGVVGNSSLIKTRLITWAYICCNFRDYKIKLSGQLHHDRKRLAVLPEGAPCRADANNLWSSDTECIEFIRSLGAKLQAIEEPVNPGDFKSLANISKQLRIPVILDESLYTIDQLSLAAGHLSHAIVNVRVSKCGGILRSIRLANQCLAAGYDIILGAQVGETSLLTRAALVVSNGMDTQPVAREGAYGTILLKKDICRNSLRFGRSGDVSVGRCDPESITGLGVDVLSESVQWVA